MNVIDYCREEVERQGHDTTSLNGIERVAGLLEAWSYALKNRDRLPVVDDVHILGRKVEPANRTAAGFRECGVRVGVRVCPDFRKVPALLVELFENAPAEPLEFYRKFEEIHPFVDGNGRTGKVLLNWLNGTLLDPIFPPNDFWGRPIRNP